LAVALSDGERILRYEVFGIGVADRAVARFDRFCEQRRGLG